VGGKPSLSGRAQGNRNEFIGKSCAGYFLMDSFFPDGREKARFTTPWWRSGRWCQLEIRTADEPLTLKALGIIESRYPAPVTSRFRSDDTSIDGVVRVCVRGMQMDMHEHLCDGPHYEQQMYVGDSYVQGDIISAMNSDDRLVRRSISLFDFCRRDNGMLPMNCPTVGTQESATYTMIWPLMLESYMMRHENSAWLKARFPGLCHTMTGLAEFENGDGLLENLPGWNFVDWVEQPRQWPVGIPPNGMSGAGVNSENNLFYVLSLQAAARVADGLGHPAFARYWREKADRIGKKTMETFWDGVSGLMAGTPDRKEFSEHSQCLTILAGILSPAEEASAFKSLVERDGLSRATDYFRYYRFKVYAKMGRMDLFMKKLDFWREHVKLGIRCPLEDDDFNSKSDCHAWAAHPLFFLHSAVVGVTPAEPWFKTVRIAPQPGGLKWIDAATPHPKGMILTKLSFSGGVVEGEVTLPEGVSGVFEWNGRTLRLCPGTQKVAFPD
jgi:hypothetical protein